MSGSISPLDKTFAILGNSPNSEADAILSQAVISLHDEIARRAARSISQRQGHQRVIDLMKRAEQLGQAACEEFGRFEERLAASVKQCVLSPQPELRSQALEFVRRTASMGQLSQLLQMADDPANALQSQTSDVARELVTKLAYRIAGSEQPGTGHLSEEAVRAIQMHLLNDLDRRCEKFDDIKDQELYVECILLLGAPTCTAVRNVLDHRGSGARHMVKTVLAKGQHPHLIDLVCEALTHNEPHQKLLQVFVSREDAAFVSRVLEWLPASISGSLERNLREIDELPWMSVEHPTWLALPLPLHGKLVGLINALDIPPTLRQELKKWILSNSGPEGRAAAGDLFDDLGEEEAQEVLYEALADENPEVEAWATHQLRSQKVPDAFAQLLKRLDATSDLVRDAARDELADFNLEKLYGVLAKLPKEMAMKCGDIVRKIDPNTAEALRAEMQHAFRWKKLRASRAAVALGMVDELLAPLAHLTEDPDTTVRRTAIESLQESHSAEAIQIIERRLNDPNRVVRETAKRALSAHVTT